MSLKKCLRCTLVKPISGNNKICDCCKANEWYESRAERWLYSQVERAGIEILPRTTEELIEVLELRKLSIKASMGQKVRYQIGHRYPSSKGGRLVPSNLIILPKFVNTKIGDEHGEGLEHFIVEGKTVVPISEFRLFVQDIYDISKLARYKDSDFNGDIQSPGISMENMMCMEYERLELKPISLEYYLDSEENIALAFASACNGEDAFWKNYGCNAVESKVEMFKAQDKIMAEFSLDYSPVEQVHELEVSDYEYSIKVITHACDLDDRSVTAGNGRYFLSLDANHSSHFDNYEHRRTGIQRPMHPNSFYKIVKGILERLDMTISNLNYRAVLAVMEADKLLLETQSDLSEKLTK
ncbi:hypothetical protein OTK49_21885 [Vibrio coralliirubri]|uniref:hypothetical protein n=1 Tax=Vibrio coralliirubri TaxID=1516159 RepID=UPI002284C92A|nr:hypothetical protein [Vibrio coralliirubri]MCY9865174.1 hypothetical protein [Vibrio coralliirubri]